MSILYAKDVKIGDLILCRNDRSGRGASYLIVEATLLPSELKQRFVKYRIRTISNLRLETYTLWQDDIFIHYGMNGRMLVRKNA